MHSRNAAIAIVMSTLLGGCSWLGIWDDEPSSRQGPPPSVFAEDVGAPDRGDPGRGEGAADMEFMAMDDALVRGPGPTEPHFDDRGGFDDFSATTSRFDGGVSSDPYAQDPRDRQFMSGRSAGLPSEEFAAATGQPPQQAPAPATAFAAYLGFVPDRASAELYLDWLWSAHGARLTGAQPYLTPAPDPNTGAPAMHIYALDVSRSQADGLCGALAAAGAPCQTIAR